MSKNHKIILGLISADIVVIAILFLFGITGVFSSSDNNNKNTSIVASENSTESTTLPIITGNTTENAPENTTAISEKSSSIMESTTIAETTTKATPETTTSIAETTTPTTETTTSNVNSTIDQFIVLDTTSTVYLRDMPSTSGKIIKELPANTHGDVISTDGSWTKVSCNGTTGYVYSAYLVTGTSAADLIKQLSFSKVIVNSSCNMRSVPDTKAPIIGCAKAGTTYQYDTSKSDSSWYAIFLSDGSTAYISTGYASITN